VENFVNHKRYALSWALSVVERLQDAYPRASEIVLDYLHISSKKLAILLAIGNPYFAKIRTVIHAVEKSLKNPDLMETTTQLCSRLTANFWEKDT